MINRKIAWLVLILTTALLSFPAVTRSDNGNPALRIQCNKDSDSVEIEPFTAWDGGNSPYPNFDFDNSSKTPKMIVGETTYYSLARYVFDYNKPLHHKCRTKTRTVNIKLFGNNLTVSEDNVTAISELGFNNSDLPPEGYSLVSKSKNRWKECIKPMNKEQKCIVFSRPKNNSELLVAYALHPDMIGSIKKLLESGANPNSRRVCGVTALHIAAAGGGLEVVRLLVERGAQVNARDCGGETPLGTAKRTRSYSRSQDVQDVQNQTIDYLLKKNAEE